MNPPRLSGPSLGRLRAKLIFNPGAGAAGESPFQLMDVIKELQAWKLLPEAYLVEPGSDLPQVVQDALAQGFRMFVVCGGDGTISAVARTLAGTHATLGIIPMGTQNNTALSLGIPSDIPAAVAILRAGRRIKVDVGMATCASSSEWQGYHALPGGLLGRAGIEPFPVCRRYPTRQPGAGRRFLGHAGRLPAGRDTPGAGRQAGDPQFGPYRAGLQHARYRPPLSAWQRIRLMMACWMCCSLPI